MLKAALRADWEKHNVLIVDPDVWHFYARSDVGVQTVYRQLMTAIRSLGIKCHTVRGSDSPVDIWIRDWGPIEGCYFKYNPDYARGLYTASSVNNARQALLKFSRAQSVAYQSF